MALARAQERQVTFPADVRVVRVDVAVVGRDGKPVPNLLAADFVVEENGHRREIISFEAVSVALARSRPVPPEPSLISEPRAPSPEKGRQLLIFFDDIHISAVNAERARAVLRGLVAREVREGDWVTVVAPEARLWWTARTAWEHQQLTAVVDRLKGDLVRHPFKRHSMGEYDAMRLVEFEPRTLSQVGGNLEGVEGGDSAKHLLAEETYLTARRRLAKSLRSLHEAVQSLAGFRGRKNLIFVSEGFIRAGSDQGYDRVIDAARRAHVAVHFVYAGGLSSGRATADGDSGCDPIRCLEQDAAGTAYVAAETGGRSLVSNDVTAPIREILDEASTYYLLGFEPRLGGKAERRLKVLVQRKDVTVRARTRYVLGGATAGESATSTLPGALVAVADKTDLPMRVGTLFRTASPGRDRQMATALVIEFQPQPAERDLELLLHLRSLDGHDPVSEQIKASLPASPEPVGVMRQWVLAPGVWQARVVVEDRRTERLGSVLHTFEVPAHSGLRLSTPILTDRPETETPSRSTVRLSPAFKAGGRLYCQYEVVGAVVDTTTGLPHVQSGYRIVRDGHVVRDGGSAAMLPTTEGLLVHRLEILLDDLGSGDYDLILHVVDESARQTREAKRPFHVVPRKGQELPPSK